MRDSEITTATAQRSLTTDERPLFVAEYHELRTEIVKRIEIQHQLISIAVIAPGTVLAVGIQARNGVLVLLYPVFALFLAAAWSHNGRRAWTIGHYLQQQIQRFGAHDVMRWEGYVRDLSNRGRMGRLNFFATQGVFVGTQTLAIIVGASIVDAKTLLLRPDSANGISASEVGLLMAFLVALISTFITVIVLRPIRDSSLPQPR